MKVDKLYVVQQRINTLVSGIKDAAVQIAMHIEDPRADNIIDLAYLEGLIAKLNSLFSIYKQYVLKKADLEEEEYGAETG